MELNCATAADLASLPALLERGTYAHATKQAFNASSRQCPKKRDDESDLYGAQVGVDIVVVGTLQALHDQESDHVLRSDAPLPNDSISVHQ